MASTTAISARNSHNTGGTFSTDRNLHNASVVSILLLTGLPTLLAAQVSDERFGSDIPNLKRIEHAKRVFSEGDEIQLKRADRQTIVDRLRTEEWAWATTRTGLSGISDSATCQLYDAGEALLLYRDGFRVYRAVFDQLYVGAGVQFAELPERSPALGPFRLSGTVLSGYGSVRVAISGPDGNMRSYSSEDLRLSGALVGNRLELHVPAAGTRQGRYRVGVYVHGPRGPEPSLLCTFFNAEIARPFLKYYVESQIRSDQIDLRNRIVLRVNAIRAQAGVQPLGWNDKLATLANDHADDMARNDFYAHVSPRHGNISERAERAFGWLGVRWAIPLRQDFTGDFIGDLIARAFSVDHALDQWLIESPLHRGALLSQLPTSCGAGCMESKRPTGASARNTLLVFVLARTSSIDDQRGSKRGKCQERIGTAGIKESKKEKEQRERTKGSGVFFE